MKLSSLCYLEKDGCYLMLYRNKKKNDENGGKWIGVGGKFEKNESPEDCMIREVSEETGFSADAFRFRGIVTFVSDVYETEYMFLYTCDGFSGDRKDCDEGELRWIPKDEISGLPLWEGDRVFLALLEKDAPFFSLKLVYEKERLASAVLDGENLPLDHA